MTKVKFTKEVEFAVDGINIVPFKTGDEIELSDSQASIAVKNGFAKRLSSEDDKKAKAKAEKAQKEADELKAKEDEEIRKKAGVKTEKPKPESNKKGKGPKETK